MTLVNFVIPVGDAELVIHHDDPLADPRREHKPVNETPLLKVPA